MSDNSYEKNKMALFAHWDNIPLVIELDPDQYEVIRRKTGKLNLRAEIVTLLADGIEDTYPGNEETIKRHALSAKEIKNKLEERLNESLTSSNIYFHLQKLEESNIVKIVGSLPSGRRYTAYYGRTARVFLLNEDITFRIIRRLHERDNKKNIDDLIAIIRERNPNMKVKELQNFKDKLLDLNQHRIEKQRMYTNKYTDWIIENEEIIRETNTNLIDFYFIFQDLINYQQPVINIMTELKELIGIKEYL